MPVILNPDSYDLWLDPGMKEVTAVSELLRPLRCPADAALSSEQSGQYCR